MKYMYCGIETSSSRGFQSEQRLTTAGQMINKMEILQITRETEGQEDKYDVNGIDLASLSLFSMKS